MADAHMIIDLFAGGGGASVGLESALGRPVDVALNHDQVALQVHRANHRQTLHLEADIWEVKPMEATGGNPVEVLWASPDCTHFSVAKGGKPRKQKIRSLAKAVVTWAREVRPAVIFLENVQEFAGWGPLDAVGQPIKARMGETFRRWRRDLERLGYVVDHRVLDASLYGAPTRRRRLFLVARCDGRPIRWPEPTHGPGRLPLRTAAECIDWSIPCPSIFERQKPLAEKTLWRIAQGIRRFVLESPRPFIVGVGGRAGQSDPTAADAPVGTVTAKNDRALVVPSLVEMNHRNRPKDVGAPLPTVTTQDNRFNLVAPTLVKVNHGKRDPRGEQIDLPLSTVTATQRGHALVTPVLATIDQQGTGSRAVTSPEAPLPTTVTKNRHAVVAPLVQTSGTDGQPPAQDVQEPMPTVTAGGNHVAEVRAFLTTYYGEDGTGGQDLLEPMRTVTAKHRLGLVTVEGVEYQITDIGMRMLEPEELLRAQFGRFAEAYDLTAARTKEAKVRLIGNSVCPEVAEALVRANLPEAARVAA